MEKGVHELFTGTLVIERRHLNMYTSCTVVFSHSITLHGTTKLRIEFPVFIGSE